MSGGVDSSVAAALLVEEGFDVRGVTLQVWEQEDELTAVSKRWQERGCCKVGLAKHVAKLLDIPHEVIDTRERFRQSVVEDFTGGYTKGTTPNPCVRCNERVKFRSLYDLAIARGMDYVATGHYARIDRLSPSQPLTLWKAGDQRKDQSYFLYRLPPSWLPRILLPLAELQKEEVWRRAEAMGLPMEELKESQEICFVTQGNYRDFIKENMPDSVHPGPMVSTTGRYLGRHQGIAFYTPGQRKGLGVSAGERLYVQRVIPETNTVVLGTEDQLVTSECFIGELNLFDPDALVAGGPVEVKIRYASPPAPAVVHWESSQVIRLAFVHPLKAVSPGQSAVMYRGGQVLGGGIIQLQGQPPSTMGVHPNRTFFSPASSSDSPSSPTPISG